MASRLAHSKVDDVNRVLGADRVVLQSENCVRFRLEAWLAVVERHKGAFQIAHRECPRVARRKARAGQQTLEGGGVQARNRAKAAT